MKALIPTTLSKAARSSFAIGACWRSSATNGTRSGMSVRLESWPGLGQLVAKLPQGPVDATLDGRELLAGQLGDLGNGQVGAVPQGDGLALLLAQRLHRAGEGLAVLDGLGQRPSLACWNAHGPLHGPGLGGLLAHAVAQAVEGDRIDPRLLARLPPVEPPACPARALRGLAAEVRR